MFWENLDVALLVDRVVASFYQTNCWIIAPSQGEQCLIIDPGIDLPNMVARVKNKLEEHRLEIGAILITHGHLDHTFSLFPVAHEFGCKQTLVHEKDRDLLEFPERALSAQSLGMFQEMREKFPETRIAEPEGTFSVSDNDQLTLGGMKVTIKHTPGHTPGSIIATIDDSLVITGDTLFAGSIGRTDLPRGSISDMERSLREKISILPGHLRVLPGHGDESRIDRELKENPYLHQAMAGRLA